MTELMDTVWFAGALVAQVGESGPAGGSAPTTGAPGGAAAPGGGQPTGLGFPPLLLLLGGFLLLMIFTSFRSQKKEERRRKELINSLKKHDKVQTHAGIIGTVVELKDDQVVLKVDEASNTRIRFAKSAVAQVIASGRGGGSGAAEPAGDEDAEADLART